MSPVEFLKKLPSVFNSAAAADTNCIIQFNISSPVYAQIQNSSCTIQEGSAPNADVTLTMADDDLVKLLKGELNGMMAFVTGKLKVDGNLMLAQRMPSLFDATKLG